MSKRGVSLFWFVQSGVWTIADYAARFVLDQDELKHALLNCGMFSRTKMQKDDNLDILARNIRDGKFIHFQTTAAFNGGMDAYLVLRQSGMDSAIVFRFCASRGGGK